MKMKVHTHALQSGDVVGSGETIVQVWAGLYTPKGKMEVCLSKNGRRRTVTWGKHTKINVERADGGQ